MKGILSWAILGLLFMSHLSLFAKSKAKDDTFRFHLMGETYTIDPIEVRGTEGSYLFHNLYRGLYRYHRIKGLIPEGAKKCQWLTNKKLKCDLRAMNWSNGQPVKATHYINAFRRLLSPNSKSSNQEFLKDLKNASEVLKGTKKQSELGVKSITNKDQSESLIFEFSKEDPDFLYKLALPALSPIWQEQFPERTQASTLVVNGPYQIKNWIKGYGIQLTPNVHYPFLNGKLPPPVEVLFVDDDTTALRLYEAGKLSFLRRVISQHIGSFKSRSDFYQFPMARFDFMGFGPLLKRLPDLRKALALGSNYLELKGLLFALGTPGCPALPENYMSTLPCHQFDPNEGRQIINRLKQNNQLPKSLTFQYSKMGGEDIRRQAEWFQHQWKKNLDIKVNIEGIEQGMLTKKILSQPGDIFRKGQTLDRPTCLAALETLTTGHPENYLQLKDKKYDQMIKNYVAKILANNGQRDPKDCTRILKYLMDQHLMIPLGEIHFSMLASKKFIGWHINELNQLDLTELSVSN